MATIAVLLQNAAQPGTVNEINKNFHLGKIPNPRTLKGLTILLNDVRQRGNQVLVNMLEQQLNIQPSSQTSDE